MDDHAPTDHVPDAARSLPAPARTGLSAGYGLAGALRRGLYDSALLRVAALGRPTISIGNLAVGGTGKTPFLIWLAERLLAAGLQPGVLARGYRREAGETLNDEGREIEAALEGRVPQQQDPKRTRGAAALLTARPDIDVLLLDDAFQHRQVARELDIVLLDARSPLGNGRVLPAGILREPPSALRRADLVVLTRGERAAANEILRSRLALARWTDAPTVLVRTEASALRDPQGTPHPPQLDGEVIAAACGIGQPAAFLHTLAGLGAHVVNHFAWGDHRLPGEATFRRQCAEGARLGATRLLVTRKDAMRLPAAWRRSELPVWTLETTLRIVDGHEALDAAVSPFLAARRRHA